MQVWNLLHAAHWKHRTQKVAKNRHLGTITQLCRAISSQLRHVSTIGKKLSNNNISSTCLQNMVNCHPLTAEIGTGLGHPSKFQRVSRLGFVTAATSLNGKQPNFAWCLAVSWAGTLYIHFRGLLPRNGILPGPKFTLRPSLVLSYIGSVTARHSSTGRQPNCGIEQRAPPIFGRAAMALAIGPHSSFECAAGHPAGFVATRWCLRFLVL